MHRKWTLSFFSYLPFFLRSFLVSSIFASAVAWDVHVARTCGTVGPLASFFLTPTCVASRSPRLLRDLSFQASLPTTPRSLPDDACDAPRSSTCFAPPSCGVWPMSMDWYVALCSLSLPLTPSQSLSTSLILSHSLSFPLSPSRPLSVPLSHSIRLRNRVLWTERKREGLGRGVQMPGPSDPLGGEIGTPNPSERWIDRNTTGKLCTSKDGRRRRTR